MPSTQLTQKKNYVIILKSEAHTLQDNTIIGVNFIAAGELVVKEKYICSMQKRTH